MRFWLWVLATAAIVTFIGTLISAAWAHEWYDPACCSGQDCRPLAPTEYRFDGGRWYLRNADGNEPCGWQALSDTTLWDSRARVRISSDFDMHGCFNMSGKGCTPLCIYVGGGV